MPANASLFNANQEHKLGECLLKRNGGTLLGEKGLQFDIC
jgi:hypothetical protein